MSDGIKLIRGDGIRWLRDQAPASLDGIFTDPPWGAGPAIVGQDRWKELIHEMSIAGYRALKPGGRLLIWIGINRMDGAIREVSRRFVFSGAIVIRTIPPTCRGRWVLGGDHVLIYGKGGYARPVVRMAAGELTLPSLYGNFSTTGIRTGPDTNHPCARDPRPATSIARQWFKEGEHVADPFGGSAVIACALGDCGVRATSIDVDPKMHRTALARLRHRTMNVFVGGGKLLESAENLLNLQPRPGEHHKKRRRRERTTSRVH
jgi:16S rRNA G966 N2-methylase RsmD